MGPITTGHEHPQVSTSGGVEILGKTYRVESDPPGEEDCQMTEDVRGEELDRLRSELAKQRANNERMTATLREARAQILTLKAEVDRLAEPPSAYGVYLDTLEDGSINIFTGGRKMRVVATPAVDVSVLVPGQEVMLNEAMNIVEIAGFEQRGDIVMLKEILEGGARALVIAHTDEEQVVHLADPLRTQHLRAGDSLLVDARSGFAVE